MKQFQNIRRGKSLIAALSAALAILLFASSLGMIGEVYATEESTEPIISSTVEAPEYASAAGVTYTINYSTGSQPAFTGTVQKKLPPMFPAVSRCPVLPLLKSAGNPPSATTVRPFWAPTVATIPSPAGILWVRVRSCLPRQFSSPVM